jgi:WD40 repeat protein
VQLNGVFVYHLELSCDGRHFAAHVDHQWFISRSFSERHSVFLGEVASGKVLHEFEETSIGFRQVAFTSDGKRLATVRGGGLVFGSGKKPASASVWDVANGKELRRFEEVLAFALAPDGEQAAAGRVDGTIVISEITTGKEIASWKAHDGPVWVLEYSPDGKVLASGRGTAEKGKDEKETIKPDYSVRLWDHVTGKERRRFPDQGKPIDWLTFSPDGQVLASLVKLDRLDEGSRLSVWSTATGDSITSKEKEIEQAHWLSFSPDSKTILCGRSGGPATLVDIQTGKAIGRFGQKHETIKDCAFSPDGRRLAAVSDGIRLWEIETGKDVFPSVAHRGSIRSMVFSPDGKNLAALDTSERLLVWDLSTAKVLIPDAVFSEGPECAYAFAHDGKVLTVVEKDGAVRVWEVATGKKHQQFRLPIEKEEQRSDDLDRIVHFSADGIMLAVAVPESHEVQLWNVVAGKQQGTLRGHDGGRFDARFAPDGKTLVSLGDDQTIRVWDAVSAKERACFCGKEREHGVFAYTSDGKRLAWSWDGTIHLWDLTTEKELSKLQSPSNRLRDLAFAHDGETLAAVEDDGTVRTWDVEREREVHAFKGKDKWDFMHPRLLTSVSGPVFAEGAMDPKNSRYELRVARTGQTVCPIQGWRGDYIAISPDGRFVASGAEWITIRDATTGRERAWLPPAHRGRRSALAFSPDGKYLASGGEDSVIILWDLSGLGRSGSIQLYTLPRQSLEKHWTDLALNGKPYDAVHYLLGDPEQTVPFLKDKLGGIEAEDAKRVRKWIAQLEDAEFEARENATAELAKLGKLAEPSLRDALGGTSSADLRRRLKELLEKAKEPSSLPPDFQRALKALEVLELLDSPAARRVLEELAKKNPDAWLGREAKAALDRAAKS